ncbi:hypothetical protein GX408_19445, partial [bacterium]|nr:hypothetical protein [bacterium]
ISRATRVLFISKYLERMADHAVNLYAVADLKRCGPGRGCIEVDAAGGILNVDIAIG